MKNINESQKSNTRKPRRRDFKSRLASTAVPRFPAEARATAWHRPSRKLSQLRTIFMIIQTQGEVYSTQRGAYLLP